MLKIALLMYTNSIDKSIYMPLGIRYLKSYALAKCKVSPKISIIDNINEVTEDYHILAISCMSQDFESLCTKLPRIKKMGIEIWLGGYHISWMPETLPQEADLGMLFEGEETFRELIDLRMEKGPFTAETLSQVKGIVYRNEDNIIVNERRELISDMDQIPFPDRVENVKPYWKKKQNIFSSRGCPFSCVFCSSTKYWLHFRGFSAKYVVSEIEDIMQKFPDVEEITFVDDLFTANKKRLKEIIELLEEKEIIGKIIFNMSIRIDLVDQELCDYLKRMKAGFIYFGLESANERILAYLKNHTQTVDNIKRGLALLKENNIVINTSFIVGTNGETEVELRETYEFLLEQIKHGTLEEVAANVLLPMPGTALWQEFLMEYSIPRDEIWDRMKFYGYTHTEKYFSMPFERWVSLRKNSKSLYINKSMDEERLYQIMKEYDLKIKRAYVYKLMKKHSFDFELFKNQIREYKKIVFTGINELTYILVYLSGIESGKEVQVVCFDETMQAKYILDYEVYREYEYEKSEDTIFYTIIGETARIDYE